MTVARQNINKANRNLASAWPLAPSEAKVDAAAKAVSPALNVASYLIDESQICARKAADVSALKYR